MDEIAFIDTPASPWKCRHTSLDDGGDPEYRGREKEKDKKGHRMGGLSKVGPDEFWERMFFRQECIAGAATGLFPWAYP